MKRKSLLFLSSSISTSLPFSSNYLQSSHSMHLSFQLYKLVLPTYTFLLLSFLFLLSESRVTPVLSSSSLSSPSKGAFSLGNYVRLPRSPFMPPTVTAYKPSIKKSPTKTNETSLRVSSSTVHLRPPNVSGQAPAIKDTQTKRVKPQISSSQSYAGSSMPRAPMVIPYVPINSDPESSLQKNNAAEGESVLAQNDQHSLVSEQGENDRSSASGGGKSFHEHSPTENDSEQTKLSDYNKILEAIDQSSGKLLLILKKNAIPLDTYLEFIKKGVTVNDVSRFLKLEKTTSMNSKYRYDNYSVVKEPSKGNPTIEISKYGGHDPSKSLLKVFTDVPFTEIVHEVYLERGKSYDGGGSEIDEFHSNPNRKVPSKKMNKNIKESASEKSFHKSKTKKSDPYEKNPFLMTSNYSTMLPPQDSPMIIPFLPPKRRKTSVSEENTSASIISMTVEEKEKILKEEKSSSKSFPIRSKVLASNERVLNIPKSERRWNDEDHYERQQENLRLVFPMKGILLFCGALGAVAVVTILILIIYGTLKCNRKPMADSYQLSEHREIIES